MLSWFDVILISNSFLGTSSNSCQLISADILDCDGNELKSPNCDDYSNLSLSSAVADSTVDRDF